MTLTGWTDEELAANRRGELADSQKATLRARGRTTEMTILIAMFILVAGFSYLMIVRGDLALHIAGAVFDAMVVAFGTLALVLKRRALAEDLAGGKVVATTGLVEVTQEQSGRQKGHHTVIRIAGKELRGMVGGLETYGGKTVTVFALPSSGLVFAVDRA